MLKKKYIYLISLKGPKRQSDFIYWQDWTHYPSLRSSNKEKNGCHLPNQASQHNLIVVSQRKKTLLSFVFHSIFHKPLFRYFEGIWKESFGSHSQSNHSKGQQWKEMLDHLGVWLTSQTTFCRAADTQECTKQNKRRKCKQWGWSFGRQTWIKHIRRRRTDCFSTLLFFLFFNRCQQHKRRISVVGTHSLSTLFLFMTNLIQKKNQYKTRKSISILKDLISQNKKIKKNNLGWCFFQKIYLSVQNRSKSRAGAWKVLSLSSLCAQQASGGGDFAGCSLSCHEGSIAAAAAAAAAAASRLQAGQAATKLIKWAILHAGKITLKDRD